MPSRRYWLFKSEPSSFSLQDLKNRPQQTEHWDGVRNFQARNLLRDEIKPGDLEIQLNEYEVALGPSAGKAAEVYIGGHIDKGCFVRSKEPRPVDETKKAKATRRIGFVAELKDPFGVLLR